MTTIAANLQGMSGDKQNTYGDQKFHNTKIFKIHQSIIGLAGDCDQCEIFLAWYKNKKNPADKPEEFDEIEVLELTKFGLYIYPASLSRMKVDDPFYAIGSGSQAALAAMHLGKNPIEAVEIASIIDPSTGGGVDYIKV